MKEIFPESGNGGGEAGAESKLDPAEGAIRRIRRFFELTPGAIQTGELPELPEDDYEWLQYVGVDFTKEFAQNKRLAWHLIGLEFAVLKLLEEYRNRLTVQGKNAPVGEIRHTFRPAEGEEGLQESVAFLCKRAGSDFGVFLSLSSSQGSDGEDMTHSMLLPSDFYLLDTIRFGNPHEPQFIATEKDTYSNLGELLGEEALDNGGIARRAFAGGIYRPGLVEYYSLYTPNAPGLERYLEIAQTLLKALLAVYESASQQPSANEQ